MTTVFVVAPVRDGRDTLASACADLTRRGFAVVSPLLTRDTPTDLDALLSAMADDLALMAKSSAVVALPGSDGLPEVVHARLSGIPVVEYPHGVSALPTT